MNGWSQACACVVLGLAGATLSGCSVNLNKETSATFVRNQCKDDSDCGKGTCKTGVCVAYEGSLSTLLLAITPPLAAVGVGGVRSLQIATGFEHSSDDTKIDLSPTTIVHGFVSAPKTCASVSVQVQVTLTPREEGYGLTSARYTAKATTAAEPALNDPCYGTLKDSSGPIYEFVLSVPVTTNNPVKCGSGGDNKACYDVYVEPLPGASGTSSGDAGAAADDCSFVPQFLVNQSVNACFAINPIPPVKLPVEIPWPVNATGPLSLDGWILDVVHPLSGHVLSNPVVLPVRDPGAAKYKVNVRYAPVKDDGTEGKELIRLNPPPGVVAPVIQAELSGLQATDVTKAVFPEFGPFPAPVQLESWVWESADTPSPVPGTVELTATQNGDRPALDGIKPGIFASFSATATVTNDGKLRAVVLPGHYRARMTPQSGLHRSAVESAFDVACDHDPMNPAQCAPADPTRPPTLRAASVLVVPAAAAISGEIVQAVEGVSVDDAVAYAEPAAFKARACAIGEDAGTCAAASLGVLDLSLGEDAFRPRAVSAPVVGGRFTLQDVDCGSCSNAAEGGLPLGGASFDLTVRPPDGSRLPWLIRPGVYVSTSVVLPTLPLSLPIVHRGVVQIPQKGSAPPVARALIQAYVMRDDRGDVIKNPAGLASCSSSLTTLSAKSAVRCIRSVLQVAATQAAEDGTFELVLPSEMQ
jgi:hypothetical protein